MAKKSPVPSEVWPNKCICSSFQFGILRSGDGTSGILAYPSRMYGAKASFSVVLVITRVTIQPIYSGHPSLLL